jgi:hypothetical protein
MQLIFLSALFQLAIGSPIDATGASKSPGFASGNVIQAPINAPINLCGNSIGVISVLNPAFGNECKNESHDLNSNAAADNTAADPAVAPAADAASAPAAPAA